MRRDAVCAEWTLLWEDSSGSHANFIMSRIGWIWEKYLILCLHLFIFYSFNTHWGYVYWLIERERERPQCERETWIGCLPYVPWPRIKPATILVYGFQPADPPSQGLCFNLNKSIELDYGKRYTWGIKYWVVTLCPFSLLVVGDVLRS